MPSLMSMFRILILCLMLVGEVDSNLLCCLVFWVVILYM